jgi:hypothetical protein
MMFQQSHLLVINLYIQTALVARRFVRESCLSFKTAEISENKKNDGTYQESCTP